MKNFKNIFWDFDGVIIDSMAIREKGFREIFSGYDSILVDKLIAYHECNGGLSRFVKIRYFYEEILRISIDDETINSLAKNFSHIMRRDLINKDFLIKDSVDFIEKTKNIFNFHIASGSEHEELNFLCKALEIDEFFVTINGSPEEKNKIIASLIELNNYKKNETMVIGDSINDFDAAVYNNISFYGYNNQDLKKYTKNYIDSFRSPYE